MEKDPFVSVRIRNSVREKAYKIAKKVKRRLVKSQSFTKFLTLSSRRTGEQSTIYQVFSDIYMARKFDYENYVHYIRSAQWLKKKSRFVIYNLRLGYEICCNRCGSMFDLHVHHTTYRRLYRERMGDLMFLCRDCHRWQKNNKKAFNRERVEAMVEGLEYVAPLVAQGKH